MARYIFYFTVLCGAAIYAVTLHNSRETRSRDRFHDAEIHCLDQKWDLARTALIGVLREEPRHAGAHFYLGRAYLLGNDFRPAIAEGEFLIALNLFRVQGRVSPIKRFEPKYFELMCYVEAAKSSLIRIESALQAGADTRAVQILFSNCAFYAERARKIAPNAAEAGELNAIVDLLRPRFKGVIPAPADETFTTTPRLTV